MHSKLHNDVHQKWSTYMQKLLMNINYNNGIKNQVVYELNYGTNHSYKLLWTQYLWVVTIV